MEKLKESYEVSLVCDVFGVHRSSYKYWLNHPKAASRERIQLHGEVRNTHKDIMIRREHEQLLRSLSMEESRAVVTALRS